MIGEVVGSYRVTAKVGEGPTGVVYLAEHTLMGRRAAIKVFASEVGTDAFLESAQRAATLSHPGLVEIFDFGNHNDKAFLVMEFLEGKSLAERVQADGPMEVSHALALARQMSAALDMIHNANITHGHLTSSNIVLTPDTALTGGERVKILDTGLAASRLVSNAESPATSAAPYLAPEQLEDPRSGDKRSDLYALGCILFEMIAGRTPFPSGYGVNGARTAPLLRDLVPGVDPRIDTLVKRLLAPRVEDRVQSAGALNAAIDAIQIPEEAGKVTFDGPAMSPVSVNFDSSPALDPVPSEQPTPRQTPPNRTVVLLIALVVVLGLATVAAVVVL